MREKKGGRNLEWTELSQVALNAHFDCNPPLLSQILPFLSPRSRRQALRTAGGREKAEKVRLVPFRRDNFGYVFFFQMANPDEQIRPNPDYKVYYGWHPQERFHILCVINSKKEKNGRHKLYWLRTAPLAPHGTAKSSVAWTFKITNAYYKPEIET